MCRVSTMAQRSLIFFSLYFSIWFWHQAEGVCPEIRNCICPGDANKSKHIIKLKCSRIEKVEEIPFQKYHSFFTNISQLDLSNNSIRELRPNAFPMPNLTKLNLDKNTLEIIHDGAFLGLSNLKKLILSNNKLKELHKNMFNGLDSLETLKLNQNLMTTLQNNTFDTLPSLKQLDISGNPLICSCDIWWLRTSSIKLLTLPKCDTPAGNEQIIEKILAPVTECDWDDKPVYSLNIIPNEDQIAFEGDSLKIVCTINGFEKYDDVKNLLSWTWEGQNPSIMFDNTLQFGFNEKGNETIESTLSINDLYDKHSGRWRCTFLSSKFNQTLSVGINVITKETIYCEIYVSENDKGRYTWPETIAGHTVELSCDVESDSVSSPTVTHTCSNNGTWINLNTDNCPYTSSITRILQQFSKMNLTNDGASLIDSATRLRNFTSENLLNITHVRDLDFLVTTLENYNKFLENEPKLGVYLIEIISSALKLPKYLMEKAQQQHNACSRFIATIEQITKYSHSLEFQNNDFALKEVSILLDSFVGVGCAWVRSTEDTYLNCSSPNTTFPKGSVIDASIDVPPNVFYPFGMNALTLIISMFKDSRIFPDRNNQESSVVVGVNLIDAKAVKLSEPISITVKNNGFLTSPVLAWWDVGTDIWMREGCNLVSSSRGLYLKYLCDRLGYFSLMADQNDAVFFSERNVSRKLLFSFLHPSIYIGTFISVTCLLLASATYCFCYTHIQMSKKMKHSLANTWLCASLLFLVFSLGIHQTDHEILCQIIGLSIHYFALATLFWMAVTIKALYKRVQKSNPSVSTPSEDIPADVTIEKPMLGIYLAGWGISAILCGIAGAVNMRGYSGPRYCFLSPGPALSTVLIPASLVLFYLLIMCLLVKCAAGSADSNPQLSVGTQAIDLELLDGGGGGGLGVGGRNSFMHEACNSVRSITTPSSQAEDTEHSPVRQLKAFCIFLVFYLVAALCAAVCVMLPLQWPPYEEKVFAFAYATVCVLLGAFVLFFHCFARNDVRSAWNRILGGRRLRRKPPHIITNSFMAPSAPPLLTAISSRSNGGAGVGGFDAATGTLNNFVKPANAADEPPARAEFQKQVPNINLVRLHRQHYRGCSTMMPDGGNFYNLHQSIVAKKFFKKQRKKRNNSLQIRKCRSGGSSPVSSALLFGNGGDTKGIAAMGRIEAGAGGEYDEDTKFLRGQNTLVDRYDLSSEKHPLTYDEPDMTGCEEAKTGTESEATFTIPEYAEIPEPSSVKYGDMMTAAAAAQAATRAPSYVTRTKEQMCGTSDHDWCSCDAVSDVNSEPTYNYAYIRNGYASSRSVVSDTSSVNSPLYTSVAPDMVNSVDRSSRSRPRPRARPPRTKPPRARPPRPNYRLPPPPKGVLPDYRDEYGDEFSSGDFRKRRKDDGYKKLPKDSSCSFVGLSPSSDFSSEDKVETCV